jgi:hypothetical protein
MWKIPPSPIRIIDLPTLWLNPPALLHNPAIVSPDRGSMHNQFGRSGDRIFHARPLSRPRDRDQARRIQAGLMGLGKFRDEDIAYRLVTLA